MKKQRHTFLSFHKLITLCKPLSIWDVHKVPEFWMAVNQSKCIFPLSCLHIQLYNALLITKFSVHFSGIIKLLQSTQMLCNKPNTIMICLVQPATNIHQPIFHKTIPGSDDQGNSTDTVTCDYQLIQNSHQKQIQTSKFKSKQLQ